MIQNLHEGAPRRATRTADGHLAGPLAQAILAQGAAATVIEPGAGARVLPGTSCDQHGSGDARATATAASALELRASAAGNDGAASRKSYVISGVLIVIALAVWFWPASTAQPTADTGAPSADATTAQSADVSGLAIAEDTPIAAGEPAADAATAAGAAPVDVQASSTAAAKRRASVQARARARRARQLAASQSARSSYGSAPPMVPSATHRAPSARHTGRPAVSHANPSSSHGSSTAVSLNPVT